MTKKKFVVVFLAMFTVMILCACGDTAPVDSDVEGIQTFGETVDPSAEPSMGQVVESTASPAVSAGTVSPDAESSGVMTGDTEDQEEETAASASSGTAGTGNSAGSSSTSGSGGSGSSSGGTYVTPAAEQSGGDGEPDSDEEDGNSAPAISPPAAASSATIDQAQEYIGKSLSSLISDLGYPIRSDYDYVDESDPDAGEVGVLYFDGFTVKTIRTDGEETITGVAED